MPQGKYHVIAGKDQFIFKLKYKPKVIFFCVRVWTPLFSVQIVKKLSPEKGNWWKHMRDTEGSWVRDREQWHPESQANFKDHIARKQGWAILYRVYLPHLPYPFSFFFFKFFIFFLILKSLILTCVPKHEPPSHLPPHNISLGHPHAPAPSMLYPASDIDWRFNSYMIVYMLECHSPKSSHPLPLPLSPKVWYTHLCLFSCLAYRVVIAIFLNSIYMC